DDEAVNVAFGDKEHLYHLYGGGSVCLFASLDPYGTFRSTAGMVADSLAGIGISQRSCYVRSAEQVLAVLLNDADAAKLRVFENFHLVHIVPPWAVQQKRRPLPAACVHIVVDLGRVVVVHGGGRVEQHGQQVLLHVADFGGVVVQALHDELDVGAVQLQEPGPHHLMGEVRPGNAGGLASGTDRLHDQLHDLVQILAVGGKLPAQVV